MVYLRAFSFLIGFGLFIVAILLCTSPLMFVNIPSFILMVGIPVPIMISRHGLKAFKFYCEDGKIRNQFIDQWTRIIYSCAVASFILGVVDMLANVRDFTAIGPALAIALLTMFYAAAIKLFLLEPFRDLEAK